MHARVAGPTDTDLKRQVIEFASAASIEVTPRDKDILARLIGRLPEGATVYIAHPPRSTIADVADMACAVGRAGFMACPHIVARRLENEGSLRRALGQMQDNGISRAMLVAGDLSSPTGEITSTLEVLASGALACAGFTSIGVAGHPEGHKRIGPTTLWESLQKKQDYAEQTGANLYIVSQFSFDPGAVCRWDRQLTEHGITLPVHAGIAGPATLRTLIKYAMLCGIGASLDALMTNLSALTSVRHVVTSADEILLYIVRARNGATAKRIVQPHFFSFGGVMRAVTWLEAIRNGAFEIDADADKLVGTDIQQGVTGT